MNIVTCQRGELDFNNLGGVITAIVDQYGAREESIKLADRVVSGKRLAISQGQKQGGALFGYDREILDETGRPVRRVSATESFQKPASWSSRLVIASDNEAVEAVRYMFASVADGVAYGSIARVLNQRGVTTMFGKRFNATAVRRTVSNPVYAGMIVGGRKRRGKFRSMHDDGDVICENTHEPLVEPALFDKTQRVMRKRRHMPRARTPGRYLLTGLVYLADTGRRMQGYTSRHADEKTLRRYYALPPRYFEEYPEESDRPSFRADTIEKAVLTKLQEFMSNERNKHGICNEINRRSKKAKSNISSLESRLAAIRTRIERGTENLALASRDDMPGISRLLAGWRDEEAELKEKLEQTQGEATISPQAIEVMANLEELMTRLSEANREKLAFAIRQTVKRITLRRERRGDGKHRITLWEGEIELREELGTNATLSLTDDDVPSPGRWREVADFIRTKGGAVFFKDVCDHLGIKGSCVSRMLAQSVLSGKVINLGHQKGWIATPL
ncbi:MAG: hypothetical protein CMJ50_06880 [Planctomycetaceae bacterium]|nr:hypothetical protein [Planctomycetaceae bacterium]